jgi:YHS domain-containing protein
MNEIVKDPVCHMDVPATSFATKYEGIDFAFCSAQCKERFLEHPHLYIGFPGQKSFAQRGETVIKRRRFALSVPLDVMQAEQVRRALLGIKGILEICIEDDKIEIQYDLMQVGAEQIADQMALIGTNLGESWVERLKLGFINYLEECEIGSLEVKNPKIYR